MTSLEGKVALVIGASRGMGKQMAIELAGHGADVVVAARSEVPADAPFPGTIGETAATIRQLGRRAEAIKVDLAVGAEIDGMVERAVDVFGGIDILVHSVQYHGPGYYDAFLDTTVEQLELQMAVNAMSAVRACRRVVPHMAERGGGTIVLVTSGAATNESGAPPGSGSTGLGYPISKAALLRFIPALAKEVKELGIAVIGLSPGFVLSEHVQAEVVDDSFRGWPIAASVPPAVPGKAVGHLCTCGDPMAYTGIDLQLSDLVAQLGLV